MILERLDEMLRWFDDAANRVYLQLLAHAANGREETLQGLAPARLGGFRRFRRLQREMLHRHREQAGRISLKSGENFLSH